MSLNWPKCFYLLQGLNVIPTSKPSLSNANENDCITTSADLRSYSYFTGKEVATLADRQFSSLGSCRGETRGFLRNKHLESCLFSLSLLNLLAATVQVFNICTETGQKKEVTTWSVLKICLLLDSSY